MGEEIHNLAFPVCHRSYAFRCMPFSSKTNAASPGANDGFKFKLNANSFHIPRKRLEVLLENIKKNKRLVKDAIVDNDLMSLHNWCSNFKENLKHLQMLVFNVGFNALNELVERFEHIINHELVFYENNKSKSNDIYKKLFNLGNSNYSLTKEKKPFETQTCIWCVFEPMQS
jgi:hypothetical protein